MADTKVKAGKATKKSPVGNQVVLPKALPRRATSATPASAIAKGKEIKRGSKDKLVSSISEVRSASSVIQAIRQLSEDEGVTSNAIFTAASIGNTPFKATAYDTNTTTFNPEATRMVKWIMASMNTLQDYTKKFADKYSIRQFIEMALLDCQKTSGVGCELVLDENRLPSYFQLVSYEQIEFVSDGAGKRKPIQKVKGVEDVNLDIPNFWIAEINRDPTKAYAVPLLRASLNTTITNHEFIEDMRRAVSRTGHSRLVVTLDAVKILASAPDDIRDDTNKQLAFLEDYQTTITSSLADLTPEDSVVVFDHAKIEVADIGGSKSDYVPLMKTLNNMQATSLKTPSSIVGLRSEGSQSLSNVEALTFLKMVVALRGPVQDVLSRALTLAARLYGLDVYVVAEFESINLRPEDELEPYRAMKQSRYLEKLSLGIWTQEYYCHMSGDPYYEGMPDLSGTNFHQGAKVDPQLDNRGGTEQQLTPDTPKKSGGKSQ